MIAVQLALPFPLWRSTWLRAELLLAAAAMDPADITHVLALVEAMWDGDVEAGDMSAQTRARYVPLIRQFAAFAEADGATTLDEAAAVSYDSWLVAWGGDRQGTCQPPSLASRHMRSCAVRALYRSARILGLASAHPRYEAASGASRQGRPLNEVEAETLRSIATATRHTRHASAAAIALSGGGSSDIGAMTADDVDLANGTLRLPGGGRTQSRNVAIPGQWEYEILAHRLHDLRRYGDPTDRGLVVLRKGSAASRQAGAAIALDELLSRAGIRRDPDVKPASIQRWAATVLFEHSGSIAEAARLLGTASLDTAASAIGWDWGTQPTTVADLRPDYQPRIAT